MVKSEHKIQPKPHKAMSPSSSSSSSSSSTLSPRVKNKYKGVRMRSWGSWVSEVRAPNQKTRIWLGSYSTAEAAARAYDAALICLKGTSAFPNLNFPTSASHYHIPDSHDHHHSVMSPKLIQRVAAAAANSFLENINHGNAIDDNASSPSSLSSSSSSSSDQVEHDVTLAPSSVTDDHVIAQIDMNMPWYHEYYNLDCLSYSPKYDDHMFNGASFNQPMIEDLYEEGGIHLWNFS